LTPSHFTDKAAHTEAREALERATYERDRDEVLLGRAFDADAKEADTFAKLARYETRLERSLHRSLNELRQLQARRQNRPASPISDAVTLDVNRYPLSKLSSGRGVPEGAEPKRIPILALSAAFVPSPRSRRPVRGSQFHFCETNPIDQ